MGCRKLTYGSEADIPFFRDYQSQGQEAVKPFLLKNTDTLRKKVQSEKKRDNYYPFGLSYSSFQREDGKMNDFKFNSFEEQSELDWGVYDYGARMYDPAIGRFLSVDPLADKFAAWSPYSYVFNNPINFIDPDGMEPDPVNDIKKIMDRLGKSQGYVISTNNETGVTTIYRTQASISKDKTSTTGQVNITLTESVYTIGSNGELTDAYSTETNISASFEEQSTAFGGTERSVTGIKSEESNYDFATAKNDGDKLQKMGDSDYVVQGVSALVKSTNRDLLFSQSSDLPNLSMTDRSENAIPYVWQIAAALVKVKGTKDTQTLGLENLINKDIDGTTTMRFQLNKDWDTNIKLQRLAKKQRVIQN